MFEILLIVAQWWIENQNSRATIRPTPSLATAARPEWSHATPSRADEVPNDAPWPAPEEVAPFVNGVPPAPAILNAQGWHNAAGVFGPLFGTWNSPQGTVIDSSNDPKDRSVVTPEVADLLDHWEKGATQSSRQLTFCRTKYNLINEVETRARGSFCYVASDRGEFRFEDEGIDSTRTSNRKNAQGKPFTIEAGASEFWEWRESELLHVNHTNKTYSVVPLPRAVRPKSQNIFLQSIQEHAPFIVDIRTDSIRREWSLTLLKQGSSHVILEATPRTAARKHRFSRCLLLLNANSLELSAIKYVDADQVHETVYVLDRCRQLNAGVLPYGLQGRGSQHKGYVSVPMKWQ
ncbi:MAG: hypothetical protein JWP89_3523 [Schlesneria sp.]|nr:hypothetical protein [Schlesneria sp.]